MIYVCTFVQIQTLILAPTTKENLMLIKGPKRAQNLDNKFFLLFIILKNYFSYLTDS